MSKKSEDGKGGGQGPGRGRPSIILSFMLHNREATKDFNSKSKITCYMIFKD